MTRQEIINTLRTTADKKGITHQKIADALGMKRPSVTRILSNRFPPNMDIVMGIANIVGVNINAEPSVNRDILS